MTDIELKLIEQKAEIIKYESLIKASESAYKVANQIAILNMMPIMLLARGYAGKKS